ncbi:bifunctional DedA family/phosphatase PAP2 family protein [Marinobacter xestospongiae]|uniref:Bifunctional DedA family/phosphatase PAP2 family protein n=1 Tax=Marinobacter xestospongiae TaxID=994319 RepID=A0ABU3VT81_9GAMM|nr:bifunctional DedA family/phosphatase PAP2 family protein [Marinobacter xestospongiae]MDV2077479.1 bifunctional DedA family/phosphatase PAP2 family protein [Marinobacter xestospongiae]
MTGDSLQPLLDWLAAHPGWLALALALVAFLESLAIAGIVVPGVAILFAIAALAGQTGMPLWQALAWAGLGAVAGDGISFWLGRRFQGGLDRVWPFRRYPALLDRGERFFHLHGGKSVVIGRFVGPIRPVIPLVAGALMMPSRRFLAFNILSAIGWAPAYILPGYLVGSALGQHLDLPPHFYPVLGGSLLVLMAIYLMLFRFQLGLNSDSRLYQQLATLMARYNSTHRFWRGLSSERPASGGEFPLPSLMLALGCGALFLIWSLLVSATSQLDALNHWTAGFFSILRHPWLDPAMVLLTRIGDPPVLLALALMAALALGFRGYYAAAAHAFLACVATTILVAGMKAGFAIPRPELVAQPPGSGAFPSGHTTGITVTLGLLASFVAREFGARRRWRIYLVFSVPMVLIALSRLYLGVHWFTDVVGGLLLGLSICGFVRASYSRYDQVPLGMDVVLGLALLILTGWVTGYLAITWDTAMAAYQPR